MQTLSAANTVVNAAQKASNFANTTVETARFEVLKEPLGFMKILQFFMALLAFAIACNGSSSLSFTVNCQAAASNSTTTQPPGFVVYKADFSYPYDLSKTNIYEAQISGTCATKPTLDRTVVTTESSNIASSASFFVFTGVMAFLYSIAFGVIYVFFKHKYDNKVYFSLVDFAVTCLFTLFWFAGSIAWAKAVSDIQTYANTLNVVNSLTTACPHTKTECSIAYYPTYANLIVSCILGFGNLILWSGDIWFVLKETAWYRTREQIREQERNATNNPISPNDVNISARYNPNNKF